MHRKSVQPKGKELVDDDPVVRLRALVMLAMLLELVLIRLGFAEFVVSERTLESLVKDGMMGGLLGEVAVGVIGLPPFVPIDPNDVAGDDEMADGFENSTVEDGVPRVLLGERDVDVTGKTDGDVAGILDVSATLLPAARNYKVWHSRG